MVRLRFLILAVIVACGAVAAPIRSVQAEEMILLDPGGGKRRHTQLDFVGSAWVFGSLKWLGAGAWIAYPIVPDGFIRPWNDSFMLEAGMYMNLYFDSRYVDDTSWLGIIPLAGVRWNFYLTQDWTAFATLKAGFRLRMIGDANERAAHFAPHVTVGAHWRLNEKTYLRLETGNLGLAQVGISLQL